MKFKTTSLVILLIVLITPIITFAAQFNFSPSASATSEYTDNVNLTKDNKDDDFITTVGAGFTASLLGKTSGAELSFNQSYAFYDENTDDDGWRIPVNFRAWTSPSKTTDIVFTDTFLLTEDPVAQDRITSDGGRVEETGDTTLRRGRNQYYSNRAGLRVTHQFGREDRVYAGFTYGLLRNDNDLEEDNDNYSPSAGLNYWFTQRFGSELSAAYTRGKFDQDSGFVGVPSSDFRNWSGTVRLLGRIGRHFSLFAQHDQIYRKYSSGNDNDYMVYAPSGGFTYDITEDIYLRLGLGYYYQDIENEKDENNFFSNAEISKTWNYQRGSIKLAGLSGLTQNDFGAQNQGFQQFAAIQGSASYNFTRQFAGDINAYYRYSRTPGDSNQVNNDNQKDHRAQLNAGLGYSLTRWLAIRLGYTFNYYNSNGDNDYKENRGLLSITLRPDRPWRF